MAQAFSNGIGGAGTSLKHIGLPWRLLVFSVFIFGFSVFVFLGVKFGYGTYLEGQSKRIDNETESLASTISDKEQEGLVSFYSQLVNIEKVLNRHNFSSNVFSFLERATIPEVYYGSGSFSGGDFSISLQGKAQSFENLIGQLAVFDNSPEVQETVLERMGFEGGGTSFGLRLKLKPGYFGKME